MPAVDLRQAMAAGAGRDRIASEYVTDYAVLFERALPALQQALREGLVALDAVVELHLRLLSELTDTLIARKRGMPTALRVSEGAVQVLAAGGVRTAAGRALAGFDSSLREVGNGLNPGTTADLVAATLFVALVEGLMYARPLSRLPLPQILDARQINRCCLPSGVL